VFPPPPPFAQILPYLRIFVSTPVVEKTKTQALGGFFHKSKDLRKITQNRMFFREIIHILSFLLPNIVKNRNFLFKNPKVLKSIKMFRKVRGKFQELKKK